MLKWKNWHIFAQYCLNSCNLFNFCPILAQLYSFWSSKYEDFNGVNCFGIGRLLPKHFGRNIGRKNITFSADTEIRSITNRYPAFCVWGYFVLVLYFLFSDQNNWLRYWKTSNYNFAILFTEVTILATPYNCETFWKWVQWQKMHFKNKCNRI